VYWGEIERPDWIEVGSLDSQAVFQRHQWWRPVSALFLHADAGHVLSNGLNGILIFAAVTTTFRRWRGWLLVFLAGVLGNIASAAVHITEPYQSVGASTAVFGGVGLLVGRAIRIMMRVRGADRWRAMFVPFATGVTVLALYGVGGVHVDVVAHLMGFIAGLLIGVTVGAR
jgi:membrane associated rhomboid family serine protease